MRTILSSKARFTVTQQKSASIRRANTTKTGKDAIIVIFLMPARRALSASGIIDESALRHRIQPSHHGLVNLNRD